MNRNLDVLSNLTKIYPNQKWNIDYLLYGNSNVVNLLKLNCNNLLFPINIYKYQLMYQWFDINLNNSSNWSITSTDIEWSIITQSSHFNIYQFLNLYTNNYIFYNFVNQSISQTDLFYFLSKSNNLSIKVIDKYNYYPWCWNSISQNNNLNFSWLKKFKFRPWNYLKLLCHKNFNLHWLNYFNNYYISKYKYNFIVNSLYFNINWIYIYGLRKSKIWRSICRHPKLNLDWLKHFSYKFYNWNYIIINQNFNLKWLNIEKEIVWDFNYLIKSKYFNIKLINEYQIININYEDILKHNNFRIEWLKNIPMKYWNFSIISQSKNISVSWLNTYPTANWDFDYLFYSLITNTFFDKDMIRYLLNISIRDDFKNIFESKRFGDKLSFNLGFNIEWINLFPTIEWNFLIISQHQNLNISWIYSNPLYEWNYYLISKHPNIDPNQFINLFFDLFNNNHLNDNEYRLDWKELCLNPNISYNFIENYLDFINFESLSQNTFTGVIYHQINQQKRKIMMTKIFEEELIQKSWHPSRFLEWCLEYNFCLIN